jgi:hypothetical protein
MDDKKSVARTSFGGEVKPSVTCFVGQISQTLLLTRDILLLRHQMALAVESGRLE